MRRLALVALASVALCCGRSPRARVALPYAASEPPRAVALEVSNATGRELPMPPPDLLARAIAAVTGAGVPEGGIVDALEAALRSELARRGIATAKPGAEAPLLRLRLLGWDAALDGAGASVVFVTATYEITEPDGTAIWRAEQRRLPIRLAGPNLSRAEIRRISRIAVTRALGSLPPTPPGAGQA